MMEDEIVTVIVVRRDGSSFVDSSVLVKADMWEGVDIWLSNDEERFRQYQFDRNQKQAYEVLDMLRNGVTVSKENSVGIADPDQTVEVK